jgi:uncharacterized beta-barrel protein YwiB (DUF1934 family)
MEAMKMNKNVIISVKGNQAMDREESNIMELVTEGKYYKKGNSYYVTYKESDLTGMEGTTTTLKICEDGKVTLMRFGTVNSQFVFEQGQRHISHYDTAFGNFTVGILANTVDVNVNDQGGEIAVDYQLDVDDKNPGYNDFHLLIREVGGEHSVHS